MNMIAELVLTVVCYSNSTDTTCELKPCQGMFLDMVMDLMLMDMVEFMAPTVSDSLPS